MWQYNKAGTFMGDEALQDCGWVDKVAFTPKNAIQEEWTLYH